MYVVTGGVGVMYAKADGEGGGVVSFGYDVSKRFDGKFMGSVHCSLGGQREIQ